MTTETQSNNTKKRGRQPDEYKYSPPPKKLRSYAQLAVLRRILVRQLSLFSRDDSNSARAANWNLVEKTIEIWNRIARSDQVLDLGDVKNKWKLDLFTIEATALYMLYQCVVLSNDDDVLRNSVTGLYKVLFDADIDRKDAWYVGQKSKAIAAATKSVYETLEKLLGVIPSGFLTLSTMVVEVELYNLAATQQKTLQQSISILSEDWTSKISRMGYIDPYSVEKFNWNLYTPDQSQFIQGIIEEHSAAEILEIDNHDLLRGAIFALIDKQEAYIDALFAAYKASSSNLVQ